MLSIGLGGVRNRWTHFVGAFLAVALGVGLTVSMGLALAATTGAPQSLKDQDPDAVFRVNAMLATAATVTTFTSVFVVASTFAFSVAQRRREFGLLRTAGATPGQVRAAVVTEAALVGALAALVGCLLGRLGGPELVGWMVDERLAPAWLTVGDQWWPYQLGFWSGLLVAVVGALAASRRASHTSAVEVLRESDVDRRVMTGGRWAFGGLLLAIGLALLVGKVAADPADLLKRKTYTTQPLLLIGAFALLAPVAVRPLVRLAGCPPGSRAPRGCSYGRARRAAYGVPLPWPRPYWSRWRSSARSSVRPPRSEPGARTRSAIVRTPISSSPRTAAGAGSPLRHWPRSVRCPAPGRRSPPRPWSSTWWKVSRGSPTPAERSTRPFSRASRACR